MVRVDLPFVMLSALSTRGILQSSNEAYISLIFLSSGVDIVDKRNLSKLK